MSFSGSKRGFVIRAVIGLDSFGASAPDKVLYAHFGFGLERITETVRGVLAK